jgi:hypothetical protein
MRKRLRIALLGLTVAVVSIAGVTAAFAGDNEPGFKTSQQAMLDGQGGWTAEAIISVGDTLPGGYVFEAIPDGISIGNVNGKGTADVLVNHELSLVPFPATRQDPSNSTVSQLRFNQHSNGLIKGEFVIPLAAGYQRFCSNFVVGKEHGFERTLLLTNEEARDTVLRQEDAWHQPLPGNPFGVMPSDPGAEQAGVVVAYDVKNGTHRTIYGMGRYNHENAVGIPGYGHPVVLSGDDTFDAPASQLYLYEAASGADFWNDKGKLYAFVSDTAGVNDYGDVTEAMAPVPGHFIEVPRQIATGKLGGDPSARDITSLDYPDPDYPTPPTGIPDGPQWVLERWSNLNGVFQFIRIEDTAYDRSNPRVVYLADTGEPRAVADATTTRLRRASSGTNGNYPNGRIWKFTLGASPLAGATLDILPGANFDAATPQYANANVVHQPDNVETTADALYIQEDPGSHNSSSPPRDAQGNLQYPAFPNATNARVWRYDLATGALTVVAEVNQSVPGAPSLAKASWESSGIVDASSIFGPGAFLLDVQAHSWDMEAGVGSDSPAVPKREHGQLLLLRAPSS